MTRTERQADGSRGVETAVQIADGSVPIESAFGSSSEHAFVSTDDDGAFVISDLPAGPYHLRASRFRSVHGIWLASVDAIASNVASDSSSVVLTLDALPPLPDTRVDGSVRHAIAARPVALRSVTLVDPDGQRAIAEIIAPGDFRLRGIPPGIWTVEIVAEDGTTMDATEVSVREGEPSRVDVIRR